MVDWKKEIKLTGLARPKDGADAEIQTAPETPTGAAVKTPIWKREIRLRKPADAQVASTVDSTVPLPELPPALPSAADVTENDAPAPAKRKSPLTREISFRRRGKKATEATETPGGEPVLPAAADVTDIDGDGASVPAKRKSPLTREISFRRRGKKTAAESKPRADEPKAPKEKTKRKARPKSGARKRAAIVGLKVGASQIAAAQIVNNGHPELVQVAREPLERGIVVGGELRDPEALGAALKSLFSRHKLPSRGVRLGVGTNRIGVRHFEISGLQNAEQLENAVRFRAQEVLPIPLEEAVLDYHVVSESVDEQGQTTYRVLLIVAYRDLVERYVQACRFAGLRLIGIDLEAFALLRALTPSRPAEAPSDAAVVVVSIGHDRSTFAVSDGQTCEFTRVLDWGGGSLDVAIARALDVTPSQAEPIKKSITLNATQERLDGHTHEQAVAVYEAVRRELQTFVRELVSSLHFYQNQVGSLGIGEILLTGGTSQLPGLAAELQRLIGVTVRVGDPLARVEVGKRADAPDQPGSLAVAIGLALEDS